MNDNRIVEFTEFMYMKERRKINREIGKKDVKSNKVKRIEVRSRGANRLTYLPINGYDQNEEFDKI